VRKGAVQPLCENASFAQVAIVFELMNQLINRWSISGRDKSAVKLRWVAEAFTAVCIVGCELYATAVTSGRVVPQAVAAAMAKGGMM
jgi:hypothetical protein